MKPLNSQGMTLAEILIALAILATVATFTIPKAMQTISSTSTDEKTWIRSVKQGATELQAAYGRYRNENRMVPSTFRMTHLTPYLNYINEDSTSQIDGTPCWGSAINCSAAYAGCYRLRNGSVMYLNKNDSFNGTTRLNVLPAGIDPDGKVSGPAGQSPGKMVALYMYYDGRIKSRGEIDPNSFNSGDPDIDPQSSCDPNWFNWN